MFVGLSLVGKVEASRESSIDVVEAQTETETETERETEREKGRNDKADREVLEVSNYHQPMYTSTY